jgi:uncharacterized Tic20 family protein
MDNEIPPPNPQPPGSQPPNPEPAFQPPPGSQPPNAQLPNTQPPPLRQDRTLDATCHFLSFAGLIGIPFGNVLGPLVLWAIKKDEMPSVNEHGKESINFQISMTIYTIIAGLSILLAIGIVLLPAIIVLNLVLVIIAGVKAANGEFYRYPLTIRFIK